MNVPYIDHDAVAGVLRMHDLIPCMRQAMIDFSAGRIQQPARRIMEVSEHGGYFGGMPGVSPGAMGAKLVAFYPRNADKGLETHMALIALLDPATGRPLVTMDGGLITKMRTAAVTAAFVDAVAAPGVASLAVLGAGAQAESHLEALSLVREFSDVRIWNRAPQRAAALADSVGGRALSAEEAVRGADVVIAATGASEPVLSGDWIKAGATVASVGWSGPDGSELDAATMANTVIVDSREGALVESGNVRRWNAEIRAELGEILDGNATVEASETVVFESIGMACQDLAAAALVMSKLHLGERSK
ncbi:MAG: ornithine cyclodeaminase family protein [Woeseiaceae bacterium]|nr:ornithine cyclodeaminase family protein [Woeseiaceae bacterium]